MKTSPLDRRKASLYTTCAQGAMFALTAAGVGVAAVGLPMLSKTPTPEGLVIPAVELPALPTNTGDPAKAPVDLGGVSQRLGLVGNSPKPPEPTPSTTSETPTEVPPPVQIDVPRYLGMVSFGSRHAALITIGMKQKFLRVGDRLGEEEVIEITATSVRLKGPDGERTIELAPKGPELVGRAAGASGAAGAMAANRNGVSPFTSVPTPTNPIPTASRAAPGKGRPDVRAIRRAAVENYKPPTTSELVPFERFSELVEKLKSTGQYKTDDDVRAAAKEQYELEINAAEEARRKGGS